MTARVPGAVKGRPSAASVAFLREQRDDLTLEVAAITAERAEVAIAQKLLLTRYREAARLGASPSRIVDALERIVDRELVRAKVPVAVPLRDQQMVLGLPLPLQALPGGAVDAPPPVASRRAAA